MAREKITADDCLSCGLCCVSVFDQEAFADVTIADCERLGVRWVKRNVMFPTLFDLALGGGQVPFGAVKTKWRTMRAGPLKGCDACTCVALRGSVMNQVSCSVYAKRPQVCRDAIKPGDSACRALRREFRETAKANAGPS